MAYIPGSNQDDTIKGTSGDDIIETFAGDDLVNVAIRYQQVSLNGVIYNLPIFVPGDDGGGNDIIRGGIGSDYLSGGIGNDTVNGDAGNDILWGGLGNDSLNGGDGDDVINGHYLYYVYYFNGQEYLGSFLVGDDDPGNDTINGGIGNDIIYAGNGRDYIDGGAGFDTLYLNTTAYTSGLTILFTNAANPGTVSNGTQFRGIEEISVTTGIGSDTINLSAFITGTSVSSGAGNDLITGGVGDDTLNGEAGNDTINGGAGNDYLSGGTGNDSLNGGIGSDRLYGDQGVDTINGGDGDDSIYVVDSVDQVDGGAGVDLLNINTTSITNNVTILYTSLSTGGTISDGITTRTIKNIEEARINTGIGNDTINLSALANDATVYGGGGNDVITGTNVDDSYFADYLYGEAGNDTINGGAGNDYLSGGTGNDSLNGGIGNDRLYGDQGVDTINGGDGDDSIYVVDSVDQVDGGAGVDLLNINTTSITNNVTILYTSLSTGGTISDGITTRTIKNIEEARINTGIGNDTINLSALANEATVYGGGGNDVITGTNVDDSYFADYLYGEAGNDTINGAAGNDYLSGGTGNDSLNGGIGSDRLYGDQGVDTINGGDGDDSIYVVDSVDQVDGGAGVDLLNINTTSITNNVTILYTSLSTGGTISNGITTRTIKNIEEVRINTGIGNDTINLSAVANETTVYGGGGNDVITGTNVDDSYWADYLYGEAGNDTINGAAGNDYLSGGTGNDSLNGGIGNDRLYGDQGVDTINGGDGDDSIYVVDSVDQVDGGAGVDLLDIDTTSITSKVTILYTSASNGGTISDGITTRTIKNIEEVRIDTGIGNDTINLLAVASEATVYAGGGNDVITGTNVDDSYWADYLYGEAGNDTINGAAGNDYLSGGTGNDSLNGGIGNDRLYGNEGVDTVNGGDGDDSIYVVDSVDQVDGGAGVDLLDINTTSITSNVTILYTSASNGGTISDGITTRTIKNIEEVRIDTGIGNDTINLSAVASEATVYSGGGNDVITGTNVDDSYWADYLYGEAGNDTINGGAGDDILYGGTGNDSLNGGIGNDRLYGNEGVDTINGGDGDDSIYVVDSVDQVDGGAGVDRLDIDTTSITSKVTILYTSASTGGTISDGITTRTIKNIEEVRIDTGIGNDTINLSALASEATVYAGGGNDLITGTNVDDSYWADYLYGEAGNDTINGGRGDDVLYGGTGFDRFVFSSLANGIDRIYDFSVVDDTIVVSASGFGGGLVAGAAIAANQFVIGTAATTNNHRFIYSQSTGALFFDRDGTGASAQVQIASLSTGLALTNADIFVNA